MKNPTTANRSLAHWVATTALAVAILMASGGAAEAQFNAETRPAAASVSGQDFPEGSTPTAFPTPVADDTDPTADGMTASDESAQTIVVVEYYLHPFLPDCFWYCTSIHCPCAEIWIFF